MKKVRILALIMAAVLMVTAFAGCGTKQQEPSAKTTTTSSGTNGKKLVFGVSLPQLDADGFRANLIALKEKAQEYGVELMVVDAQNSADTQLKQFEDFITKKVDAIIFIPIDSSAMVAGVIKANTAKIPVVAFDRKVNGGTLAGLAESDNTAHGAKAAEMMVEAAKAQGIDVKDLKVLELLGTQSTSSGLERHTGFSAKAKELGINIVASFPTEFQMDKTYASTLDAFQKNSKINAIFEASDNAMHSGVESALKQLQRLKKVGEPGHIIITTVDGGPQGTQAVRNGYVDGLAAQQKFQMSYSAMDIAYNTVMGKEVKDKTVRIQPNPITKTNVDDPNHWPNKLNKIK